MILFLDQFEPPTSSIHRYASVSRNRLRRRCAPDVKKEKGEREPSDVQVSIQLAMRAPSTSQ
jgi:hypothetical protein